MSKVRNPIRPAFLVMLLARLAERRRSAEVLAFQARHMQAQADFQGLTLTAYLNAWEKGL